MAKKARSGVVLWEVDTQADFMLPGGRLYVPGAEKRTPNMKRLLDAARSGGVFLVSSADQHAANDPEFERFPPHCVRGTSGADILPELRAPHPLPIPNDKSYAMPRDFGPTEQVVLEKQTLDVFDNPNTERLLQHFSADTEFIVFGVVTEFCVRLAARGLLDRGRRVTVVTDAIETLDPGEGKRALEELSGRGAELVGTAEALERIRRAARPPAGGLSTGTAGRRSGRGAQLR